MSKEISNDKMELSQELSRFSRKEQRQIVRAANHMRRYVELISEELTPEEEADKTINELEKE